MKEAHTHTHTHTNSVVGDKVTWCLTNLRVSFRYRSAIRGVDAAWAASDLATDESKSLDIPAMVVAAQHDYVCRPEVQALAAEKFLRKFRLEKFESGHWIPLEKPDELVKLMEDFTGGL